MSVINAKTSEPDLKEPVSNYMHSDFVALRQDQSVSQVMTTLRNHKSTSEILYLYVTDETYE